jgi:hypothetical protein
MPISFSLSLPQGHSAAERTVSIEKPLISSGLETATFLIAQSNDIVCRVTGMRLIAVRFWTRNKQNEVQGAVSQTKREPFVLLSKQPRATQEVYELGKK